MKTVNIDNENVCVCVCVRCISIELEHFQSLNLKTSRLTKNIKILITFDKHVLLVNQLPHDKKVHISCTRPQ